MTVADQLKDLKEACTRGEGWAALADRIKKLEIDASWRKNYATRAEWMQALHEATGYAPSTIRRFLEAREFVERLAAERPDLDVIGTLGNPDTKVSSIALVPLIKRMYDAAPDRVNEILPAIIRGKMTTRQIRDFYERQILSEPGATVTQAKLAGRINKSFTNRVLDAVAADLASFTGRKKAQLIRGHFRFDYFTPDAVAIALNSSTVSFADGFDVRQSAVGFQPALRSRILAEATFAARFFRQYWVILPARSQLTAQIVSDLHAMGDRSVGVAEFTEKGEVLVRSRPEGKPAQDKQHLILRDILRQGIPDEGSPRFAPKCGGRRGSATKLQHVA